MKGKERICAAIDADSWANAEAFAQAVAPEVGMLKVGLELFAAEGPRVVSLAAALGLPVFLDLKLHDIPNTVLGAARSAARSGAALLTVHASGGRQMVAAAVRGAGTGVRVLAVTVLTSLDETSLASVGVSGPPRDAVVRLAKLAIEAGAGGVVCSALEVAAVRAAVGAGPWLVVPGVRPWGSEKGDQARVATPLEAISAGADMVVIGRPLSRAADPAKVAREIAQSLP